MQLALFDLDNTLLAGDSDFEWGQFLIGEGVLDREVHQARNVQFYEDYKAGTLDINAFLEFQLKPLSRHPRSQLDAWHAKYMAQNIRPMITEKSRALVQKHSTNGDLMVIITATNSFVTGPIAREFGIDHLIGTDPEQINGEFTGRVTGVPSFKDGKVTRLYQWLESRGQRLEDFETTWFYSDSHNDLPLMKLVSNPVAANPDTYLKTYAEANNWPIISLR